VWSKKTWSWKCILKLGGFAVRTIGRHATATMQNDVQGMRFFDRGSAQYKTAQNMLPRKPTLKISTKISTEYLRVCLFCLGLSPPKRRSIRWRNFTRRRVQTMCKTSTGFFILLCLKGSSLPKIIEKTSVYHTVNCNCALFHTSKTAKMIKVIT